MDDGATFSVSLQSPALGIILEHVMPGVCWWSAVSSTPPKVAGLGGVVQRSLSGRYLVMDAHLALFDGSAEDGSGDFSSMCNGAW
jgi:hypothetical protein